MRMGLLRLNDADGRRPRRLAVKGLHLLLRFSSRNPHPTQEAACAVTRAADTLLDPWKPGSRRAERDISGGVMLKALHLADGGAGSWACTVASREFKCGPPCGWHSRRRFTRVILVSDSANRGRVRDLPSLATIGFRRNRLQDEPTRRMIEVFHVAFRL